MAGFGRWRPPSEPLRRQTGRGSLTASCLAAGPSFDDTAVHNLVWLVFVLETLDCGRFFSLDVDGTRQPSHVEKTGKFRFTQPKANTSEREGISYAPATIQI